MAKKKEENPYLGGSINAGTMNNINQYAKEVASDPEALKTYRENEAEKTAQTIKELEAMTQKQNVTPVANTSNAPAMDLSRSDNQSVPYANQNAPSVVANRELNYNAAKAKNTAAQKELEELEAKDATPTENVAPTEDEIAERKKIADGVAQNKAQTPATPAASVTSGAPSTSVNVQANGAGNSNAFGKSYSARSAGVTGYKVVNLDNESQTETNQDTTSKQTTVGNQETQSTNESQGTTQQTQETAFDPNKAAENVAALDPFLEKVDKEGAAKAFLDVYGEKPSPDALNNAAELARKKNKIAVLSESLRVLFDMGAAAGGGNVYKRDQVQKNIAETKAELNKEEAKYQDALDKFNQGLLGAKGADLGTKRALMNDAIKAGYSTVSEGKNTQTATGTSKTASNQTTDGTSNTKGTQTTKAQHEQVVNDKVHDNAFAASMAAAGRGEKMVDVINTTVDKNGKVNEKKLYSFTPTQWDAVKSKSTQYIVSDAKLVKDISTLYKVSEDDVRKALVSGYSVTDMIGTKNGTMNYSDFADMVIKNHGMQNERSRQVFNAYSNRQKLTGEYESGVVNGTTMDFTDSQQPINNSGLNIAWQPRPGDPNRLLDELTSE